MTKEGHGTNKTAHSNFKKGISDYNDGENVTHHLGNDDYKDRTNLADPYEEEFDGKEAAGNDMLDGDEYEDEDRATPP